MTTLEAALDGGDVACFQLRLKDADDAAIANAVKTLMPIVRARDVAFLLNDRPDLAAELGCDGVHIGQEDAPLDEARKLVGPNAIVGVTCHNSRHLAMEATTAGADYVAFGAFFPTATKTAKTVAEPEILSWWQDFIEAPCVAIGGITIQNSRQLVEMGADFLAVSSGVWNHDGGPMAAVTGFNEIFNDVHVAPRSGS